MPARSGLLIWCCFSVSVLNIAFHFVEIVDDKSAHQGVGAEITNTRRSY